MSASDSSAELLSELRALSVSGGPMGPVDERKVRAILEEMDAAYNRMMDTVNNPYADATLPYYASSLQYMRAKYLRDKRCLLAYLLWRQRRIADAWWQATDNTLLPHLSSAEQEYLAGFNDVMVAYTTSFAVPLDLRAFVWRPPFLQQVEVRGVRKHEFVSPISGTVVSIYPGKQISLPIEDAEPLLQQKAVELVTS